jgi:hypothetical protein
MRRLLVAALLLPLPATAASSFMTDASDLWWNPAESGWGVNIIEQSNVLFATFFVYAPDGRAHWYVASDMTCPGTPTDVQMVCSGTLYETTGPVVGPGFNAAAVTRRAVGDAKFFYSRSSGGQFDYTIDGVTVSKSVQRQTWAENDVTGVYVGSRVTRPWLIGCNAQNVTTTQPLGTMTVSRSGSAITIATRLDTPSYSCDYAGSYSQSGRFGRASGNFSCSDGSSGTFTLTDIEVSKQGFLGHISQGPAGSTCTVYGNLGGARATVDQAPD